MENNDVKETFGEKAPAASHAPLHITAPHQVSGRREGKTRKMVFSQGEESGDKEIAHMLRKALEHAPIFLEG